MKKLYYLAIFSIVILSSCKKDDSSPPVSGEVSGEVTTIEQNSAVISGIIPENAKSCGVCWDTVADPTVASAHLAAEPQNGKFTTTITGLLPNRQYYAKVYAVNNKGEYIYSSALSFKTAVPEIQVKTLSASEVGLYQAKLNGEIKLSPGNSVTYWFEWGETSSYGNKTPEQTITGTGNSFQMVNADIANLKWHQVYSFRLMVKTQQTIGGGNLYFKTIGDAPKISDVQINNNELDKLIIKATVNPNHITTTVIIEWGETASYGNSIATVPTVVNGEAEVSAEIPAERMSEYHFRFRANNAIGTNYSQDTMTMSLALIDREGNKFHACKIGQQYWLTSNWRVLSYNNGDQIPNVTDPVAWGNQTNGALCFYNNDPVNYEVYGPLYNWYVVDDPRGICPDGWHVPTEAEWHILHQVIEDGKIKINSTGFAALFAGARWNDEGQIIFSGINEGATFWTSTSYPNPFLAADVTLYGGSQFLLEGGIEKTSGVSIRLIKN